MLAVEIFDSCIHELLGERLCLRKYWECLTRVSLCKMSALDSSLLGALQKPKRFIMPLLCYETGLILQCNSQQSSHPAQLGLARYNGGMKSNAG